MIGVTLRDFDRDLRLTVFRHFADVGAAPETTALAERLGTSPSEVEGGLRRLAEAHFLALAPSTTAVWMAHPFSAVPTDYPVIVDERRYWANCAWDAFGIPALLAVDSVTATRCAETAEPVTLGVLDGRPLHDDGVVHFVVRPPFFWDNVAFT